MAVFSTDQNRQFYYAGAYKASVDACTTAGDVTVKTDKDGSFHLFQMGKGGLVKSDLISKDKILSVQASAPADMAKSLKKITVSLNSEVNGGAVIPGEEYVLRINFRQLYGMSDEDIYQKYGCVAGTTAMVEASDIFYYTLAQSLVKNFKRCFTPLLGVSLDGGTTIIKSIKKTSDGKWSINGGEATQAASSITGITIVELSQASEYVRGTAKLETINFEVFPTTIYENGQEVIWGTVSNPQVAGTIGNGYDIADLEWFCMGERGDQYREKMWPNNITTKYFVNENSTYFCLDIVYAYAGDCEDIQNSKKMITIVAPTKATIASIITALTGVTVTTSTGYTAA